MKIKVINNFFDESDIGLISSLKLHKKIDDKGVAVYLNKISKTGEIKSELFDEQTLKSLHKKYHPIALNILEELSPKKKDLYEFTEFHLVEIGKDFQFSIHDDIPNKLLSGVICKPEKNSGTYFLIQKKVTVKR